MIRLIQENRQSQYFLNNFMFRKFLAGFVLALHLTPGRRLLATVQKYSRCGEFLNPPDGFVAALLDLLAGAGWSNSIEDLGTALGAGRDGEEDLVKLTTVGTLRAIVDRLLQSKDFKVRDMGKRHEINLETKTEFKGDCSHNSTTFRSERPVALVVARHEGETLNFAELQYHLKMMKFSTEAQDCQQCGKAVVKTVRSTVKEFCDPDFLTIVLEQSTNFSAPLKAGTKYGSSRYKVKAVVHWDSDNKSASVSREKEDGWWWHGVDNGQFPDFKYSSEQLQSAVHLRDVAVMMMVRMGENCDQPETDQEEAVLNTKGGETRSDAKDNDLDEELDESFNPPLVSTPNNGDRPGEGSPPYLVK